MRLAKRFIADRRGMASIEVAVLFGVIAVAFAVILTPYLDDRSNRMASNEPLFGNEVDNMVTGSISKPRRYTIRKSVLQPKNTSRCIIFSDGRKYGDC
jgi:uncharacterized protein (UPF0333 family)